MEVETALSMLADDAEIEIVGRATVVGKEAISTLLGDDGGRAAVETMEIFTIISHGNVCDANGVWHFSDGGKVAFNTMYTFDGFGKKARLKRIQTYSVVLGK